MQYSSLSSALPVIVIGAGGHSKVLIDILKRLEVAIIGVTDISMVCGELFCGIPVLGDDSVVLNYNSGDVLLVNALGSLPGKNYRFDLAIKYRALGYTFATVVDKFAFIASDVTLEEGVQVMAGVVIQPGCVIGHDTILNTNSSIDHDCTIGESCHIAPGVSLSGGVNIGSKTHIGTGVSIIQNIVVGNDSVIGAGCVVYQNVKEGVILKQTVNNVITENKGV